MSQENSFYCMRCRAKQEGKDVTEVTMKNNKRAAKGTCKVCGAGVYKVLPNKK